MRTAGAPHRTIITKEKDPSQGSWKLRRKKLIRNIETSGSIGREDRYDDKVKESESHLKI